MSDRNRGIRGGLRRLRRAKKRFANRVRRPFVWLLSRLIPASWTRGALYYVWERNGLQISRVHYYSPFPDTRRIDPASFEARNVPEGLDFRVDEQLALLEQLSRDFGAEWSRLPLERGANPCQFSFDNSSFHTVDAEILYGLLRHLQPRQMIEVGSGNTTLLASEALHTNGEEGAPCEFTAIEPYPDGKLRRAIDAGLPGLSKLVQEPIEHLPLSTFTALEAGDVLFIDSTHIVRTGGDVVYEFLEVLPRIAAGVWIHIHDIFMPDEYPREWLLESATFYNEQYLLQAFLCHNDRFQIEWMSHYMGTRHRDRLRDAFPSFASDRFGGGSSVWIQKVR